MDITSPEAFLPPETFRLVIESTPLISIDLIIKNQSEHVLLGKRKNKPAQNFWFVPGGRVRKGECLTDAFIRITEDELGQAFLLSDAVFIGVFEHCYSDSIFSDNQSTHYIVLGYELVLNNHLSYLPLLQHQDYTWFDLDTLRSTSSVHQNTKNYFNDSLKMD